MIFVDQILLGAYGGWNMTTGINTPQTLAEKKHDEYLRHREGYLARAKAWRKANGDRLKALRSTPEYKARRSALRRAAYVPKPRGPLQTREEKLEKKRQDYIKNKAHYQELKKEYYQNHKEKWQAVVKPFWREKFEHSLGKAVLKNAEIIGRNSLRDYYLQVFEKIEGQCEYCGVSLPVAELTIDHKTPYKLGGKHEVSNLAVACLLCNLKKGIKPLDEWLLSVAKTESA